MENKKMKAAVIEKYGQELPEIKEVDISSPGEKEVLIKIKAASINPIDIKTMEGKLKMLLSYKMPLILGSDASGVITETGSEVTRFRPGDEVYVRVKKDRIGTFAEYIVSDEDAVSLKPQNLTFEEAAALPLVGLTSYQALHNIMKIKPGEKVLIQAGSGGIGTTAIQIAKDLGAYVATTTSSKNAEMVKELGADEVIDYKTQNFQDVLKDYDYVFDTQGGKILEDSFSVLKPGGMVVSLSGLPDGKFADEYGVPLWKKILFKLATRNIAQLEKETGTSYYFLFMKPSGEELEILKKMAEENSLKPVIDRVYPLSEIKDAFTYSKTGRAKGKIIITME